MSLWSKFVNISLQRFTASQKAAVNFSKPAEYLKNYGLGVYSDSLLGFSQIEPY